MKRQILEKWTVQQNYKVSVLSISLNWGIKICTTLLSPEFIVGPNAPWYVMDVFQKIQFSKRKYSIKFTVPGFIIMVDSHYAIDDITASYKSF